MLVGGGRGRVSQISIMHITQVSYCQNWILIISTLIDFIHYNIHKGWRSQLTSPHPPFFFIKPSLPIFFRATYMDVMCIRLGVARGLFSTHLAISQTICHFNMHVHFSGLMRLKYIFLLIFLNFKKFRDKGGKNWRKKNTKRKCKRELVS